MDLEGQQLLRVHVVEGAQVGQLQQQLGEDGRLARVVLGDEAPQGADQGLLEALHRVHVLDAGAIWGVDSRVSCGWSVDRLEEEAGRTRRST